MSRFYVVKPRDKNAHYNIVKDSDRFTAVCYREEDADLMCEALNSYHNDRNGCDKLALLIVVLLMVVIGVACNYGLIKLVEYLIT